MSELQDGEAAENGDGTRPAGDDGTLAVERVDAAMTTRDGTRLDADLWVPQAEGPYPVLLVRTPFGRRKAETYVYAHPIWYAEQGYIVAVQDVRGTGSSEGSFDPFVHEADDGADALAWASRLNGANGAVGLYGCGYAGVTQLLALAGASASDQHEDGAIRAAVPTLAGWDIGRDWAFDQGTFRLADNLCWALLLAAERAAGAGDAAGLAAIEAALSSLMARADASALAEAAGLPLVQDGHYSRWISRAADHADWTHMSPRTGLEGRDCTTPMLHIGGWFDGKLRGTIDAFRELTARAADGARQHLVVGPWSGEPWGRASGTIDISGLAGSPIDQAQLAWFNHWLKGVDEGLDDDDPVHLYDVCARRWRSYAALPEPEAEPLFLVSTGLAASSDEDGELSPERQEGASIDRLIHDPQRPVPSGAVHGGPHGAAQDRARIDARGDVATYTTPALEEALLVVGEVDLVLYARSDADGFDISAVLSVVERDGSAMQLARGQRRVTPDDPLPLSLGLGYVCGRIGAGRRLRLSLSGAGLLGDVTKAGGVEAGSPKLIEIGAGGDGPSHLMLRTI